MKCWFIFGHCWHYDTFEERHGRFQHIVAIYECCKCSRVWRA